jgi:hypothetical protein
MRWGQLLCRVKSQKSIAFSLRKLKTAQKRCKTAERGIELLSAIETHKKYKNILFVYLIIVFTDHIINPFNESKVKSSE